MYNRQVILRVDVNAPAKNFTKNFVCGNYEDEKIINEFISKVDIVTFEFENIPYKVLKNINEHKKVLPRPEINKLIQNRYSEKDFLNKIDIRTTRYVLIKDEEEIKFNNANPVFRVEDMSDAYDIDLSKCEELMILGGEPSIDLEVRKWIDHIKDFNTHVIITTNGTNASD